MVDVTFDNVHFLWLLFTVPILVALHFFLMKYTKRRAIRFANFEALRRVTGGMVLSKNITLLVVRLLIVILLILSASGMIVWIKAPSSEFNYVITIDGSASMLAKDFDPDRLTAAKMTAKTFVDSVVSDVEVGVVSFSGIPRIEQSLTNDKATVKNAIDGVKITSTGGTDIGSAIVTSVNLLEPAKDRAKSVILLTDGRQTVGGPLSEAVKYAREKEVTVSTIAMATKAGGSFETTKLLSTVDTESLQGIASSTGGMFFQAIDEAELTTAFRNIIADTEQNLPHPLRVWFLGFGIFFLFLEWGLINTRFRVLP